MIARVHKAEPELTPDSSAYDDARKYIHLALVRAQAMRKALEMSMDAPGGMAWEEEIGGPTLPKEAEPTADNVPQMEEPTEPWQKQRLEKLRAQMRANWPDKPKGAPYKRKPWKFNP